MWIRVNCDAYAFEITLGIRVGAIKLSPAILGAIFGRKDKDDAVRHVGPR